MPYYTIPEQSRARYCYNTVCIQNTKIVNKTDFCHLYGPYYVICTSTMNDIMPCNIFIYLPSFSVCLSLFLSDSDIQHDFLDYISQAQAKEQAAMLKQHVERTHKLVRTKKTRKPLKKLKRTQQLLQRVTGGPNPQNLFAMCRALQTARCGSSSGLKSRSEPCTTDDFLQDLEGALSKKRTKERVK